MNTLDRLKVLINSSTPIVVMETSEEMHASRAIVASHTPRRIARRAQVPRCAKEACSG